MLLMFKPAVKPLFCAGCVVPWKTRSSQLIGAVPPQLPAVFHAPVVAALLQVRVAAVAGLPLPLSSAATGAAAASNRPHRARRRAGRLPIDAPRPPPLNGFMNRM